MEINEEKLNRIGQFISKQGFKLSLAESMPAGFFTSVWSLQTESGDYLQGSIICYAEEIKLSVLNVPNTVIQQYSAESAEVTKAMLHGLKNIIPADIHISVTGKAFSDYDKNASAGDVFLCISFRENLKSQKIHFSATNAAEVFIKSFNASLDILESMLIPDFKL